MLQKEEGEMLIEAALCVCGGGSFYGGGLWYGEGELSGMYLGSCVAEGGREGRVGEHVSRLSEKRSGLDCFRAKKMVKKIKKTASVERP